MGSLHIASSGSTADHSVAHYYEQLLHAGTLRGIGTGTTSAGTTAHGGVDDMHGSHGHGGDGVPSSIYYHYPVCRGSVPPARWAHTAVAVNGDIYVYGGVGHSMLDDMAVLDVQTMAWRSVTPLAARSKDRPEKMLGHAAAAVGSKVWIFGGQSGRKFLRNLYCFDVEAMTWTRYSSDNLPAARAGHAMVTVHGTVVYMFGGQGKRMYNDLYKLDTSTGSFVEVEAAGKPPAPRRGHSLVWDGRDYLVCFGGITASGSTDAHLAVFSLSRGEWLTPQAFGPAPSPRTQHSATLLAPGVILVFGGCNSSGTFFSDVLVLDTRNGFTWHRPSALNTAPAPRYHHTCCMVGGRLVLYGGINSKQTFEGVVVLETKFTHDISLVVEELFKMSSENNIAAAASRMPSSRTGIMPGTGSAASASVDGIMVGSILPVMPSTAAGLPLAAAGTGASLGGDGVHTSSSTQAGLGSMGSLPAVVSASPTAAMAAAVDSMLHASTAGFGSSVNTGIISTVVSPDISIRTLVGPSPSHQHQQQQHPHALGQQVQQQQQHAAAQAATVAAVAQQPALAPHAQQPALSPAQQEQQQQQPQAHHSGGLSPLVLVHDLASTSKSLEVVKVQLTDLLLRRNLEEQHMHVSRKAETVESLLAQEREAREASMREVLQLKLLLAEAEEARAAAQQQGRAAATRAAKEAAAVAELRTALEAVQRAVSAKDGELAEARLLQESLVKELGILASRYSKLERDALDGAGAGGVGGISAGQRLSQQQHTRLGGLLSGSTRRNSTTSFSGLMLVGGTTSRGQNAEHPLESSTGYLAGPAAVLPADLHHDRESGPHPHVPSGTVRHQSVPLPQPMAASPSDAAGAGDIGGGVSSSANRVLTLPLSAPNTASGGSHGSSSTSATPAAAAVVGSGSSPPSASQQLLTLLSNSEMQRASLLEELSSLRSKLEEARGEYALLHTQVQQMHAAAGALEPLSSAELQELERKLEASLRTVRNAVLQRKVDEAARRGTSEQAACGVCMEAPKGVAFSCGHQACEGCSAKFTTCPFCRAAITAKIRLFDS